MSIQTVGLKAYNQALENFQRAQRASKASALTPAAQPTNSFAETLNSSLGKVNSLQSERNTMIESFASGENQNVHELMIAMQKASVAVSMTSAVRNKVIEAYRELSRIQF